MLDLRPDEIVWGYWMQVLAIEQDAKLLPLERFWQDAQKEEMEEAA